MKEWGTVINGGDGKMEREEYEGNKLNLTKKYIDK